MFSFYFSGTINYHSSKGNITKKHTKSTGRIKALQLRPNIDCFGDASAGSCGCRNRIAPERRNRKIIHFLVF